MDKFFLKKTGDSDKGGVPAHKNITRKAEQALTGMINALLVK
jgi:hypothetical protein